MTLQSIEKLRESLKDCTSEAGVEPNRFDTYWITARACDMLIDEVEAEIAERYMELPVDADGVPIHVGDILERVDGGPSQQACCIGPYGFNDAPIWCARDFRNVKPRTVEDVLNDCADEISENRGIAPELNRDTSTRNEIVGKYAAELRDLIGVDR